MKTLIIPCLAIFCGCSAINEKMGLKDDNFIEEFVESQLEDKTGLDLDFTPSSPE